MPHPKDQRSAASNERSSQMHLHVMFPLFSENQKSHNFCGNEKKTISNAY